MASFCNVHTINMVCKWNVTFVLYWNKHTWRQSWVQKSQYLRQNLHQCRRPHQSQVNPCKDTCNCNIIIIQTHVSDLMCVREWYKTDCSACHISGLSNFQQSCCVDTYTPDDGSGACTLKALVWRHVVTCFRANYTTNCAVSIKF